MQRNRPVFVIGHDPIGERSCRRSFLEVLETGNAEEVPGTGPQRLARQQIRQGCVARVGHRGTDLDSVRIRPEGVRRRDRHLVPVARGLHHDLGRAAIDDLDFLIRVRPGRPVVRDEIREHDPVAAWFAVNYRRDVDDRTARHSVGDHALDSETEREVLVEDGDVAGCGGFPIDDRGGPHYHVGRGTGRNRLQREQHGCACERTARRRVPTAGRFIDPHPPVIVHGCLLQVSLNLARGTGPPIVKRYAAWFEARRASPACP